MISYLNEWYVVWKLFILHAYLIKEQKVHVYPITYYNLYFMKLANIMQLHTYRIIFTRLIVITIAS